MRTRHIPGFFWDYVSTIHHCRFRYNRCSQDNLRGALRAAKRATVAERRRRITRLFRQLLDDVPPWIAWGLAIEHDREELALQKIDDFRRCTNRKIMDWQEFRQRERGRDFFDDEALEDEFRNLFSEP